MSMGVCTPPAVPTAEEQHQQEPERPRDRRRRCGENDAPLHPEVQPEHNPIEVDEEVLPMRGHCLHRLACESRRDARKARVRPQHRGP